MSGIHLDGLKIGQSIRGMRGNKAKPKFAGDGVQIPHLIT
jgi:hypothetical protein